MITQEIENKLYDLVISHDEITTKDLNTIGLNSKDINKLIEEGKLQRIKRGFYVFVSLESLVDYGYQFVFAKEYNKALEAFKRCYTLGLRNPSVLKQLFFHSIKNQDYDNALKYLSEMINCDDLVINKECNLYLLLISNLIKLPEDLQNLVDEIKEDYNKIMNYDEYAKDKESLSYKRNKISLSCFNGAYNIAVKQISEIQKEGAIDFNLTILRVMISQIITIKINIKQEIIALIKNNEHDKVIEMLASSWMQSSLFEKTLLLLLKNREEILKGKYKAKEKYIATEDINIAIKDENYELALEVAKNNTKIIKEENVYAIILEEIVSKIKSMESKIIEEKTPLTEITYIDIANSAIQDEPKIVIDKINSFLTKKGKLSYEFLITSLYKLGILDNDLTFSKMMLEITKIENDSEYKVDFSIYVQNIYQHLGQSDLKKAKIYLEILYHYDTEKKYTKLLDGLSNVISISERVEDNNLKLAQIEEITAKKQTEVNQSDVIKKTDAKEPEKHTKKELKVNLNPVNEEMRLEMDFINQKVAELNNNPGIILLRPMDNIRRKRIHEIVKTIPNVNSYSVGKDKRQIVLKTYTPLEERIDIKGIIKEAQVFYQEQKYLQARKNLLYILSIVKYPSSYIYYLLGLTYLYNKQLYKAIDCLTVCDQLNKEKEIINESLSDFIDKLKGKEFSVEDRKPYFEMDIAEFENPVVNTGGIEELTYVIEDILINNVNINDVGEIYGLSLDQLNIIKLNLARYYFANSRNELGEKLLKEVEKTSDKTDTVKQLFREITKNKKLYKNKDSDPIAMILSRKKEENEKH